MADSRRSPHDLAVERRVGRALAGRLASKMVSARIYCPQCNRRHVLLLNEVFYSPNVDFFRCEDCRYMWHVDKDKDGPASRTLLGESNEAQNTRRRINR